ncbi:MAG: sugar transferase [Bacilli bacterium]|nr:sugar transferase [Bacilli bacterium]MDY4936324.1 sugar transferase [Candidatus Enteromonas sp.]
MDNKITPRKVGFFYFFSKYTFDFLVSLISIIILLPAFIIIGIIVKCSSKGPIFFVDKRVGKNEKMIGVLKFRTMYVDAETNIEKYLTPEQIKAWKEERKLENDPRITKIGNFLRKSSLDELPQLFNILIGQMSIVGPRPISKREYDAYYNDEEKKILSTARPGLTGYWQVYGRNEVDYASGERSKLTMEYFKKRSLLLDLKIIFKTFAVVISGKGAE